MKVPDLTQKVIGYRQWNLDDDLLLKPIGMTSAPPWVPGPMHAICWNWESVDDTRAHVGCLPVVNPYCECGFYGLRSLSNSRLDNRNSSMHHVTGIILGWGRMAVHDEGWRAQWVEVAALLLRAPDLPHANLPHDRRTAGWVREWTSEYGDGSIADYNRRVRETAKKYGVPTVPWDKAESFAEEFGATMPRDFYEWSFKQEREYNIGKQQWQAAKHREKGYDYLNLLEGPNSGLVHCSVMMDHEVPEAMAACYDVYVPNPGEFLEGVNYGIEVQYLPVVEEPKPADIDVGRAYELCVSDNATILHLPTRSIYSQ